MGAPMPVFEELYTSGRYRERNPDWHVGESPWKAQQILRMLRHHHLTPRTIGEVGCGAGEVLKQLQAHMDKECRFWGYEISPPAFALCQSRANERLQCKLADIRQEHEIVFDLLLILDVLEHVEDYYSLLRGIQPKGHYKIFHLPLDLSVQTIVRSTALLKRRDLHAHIHYFTKELALRTLEDVGYEVLDYRYTPRSLDLARTPVQRVLSVPRKLCFTLHQDLAVRTLGGFSLLVLAT